MSEHNLYGDVFETMRDGRMFVDTLDDLIYHNCVIVDGYCGLSDPTEVRSAKVMHKKIIGKLSIDQQTIYLFPDLLIKQLKKHNRREVFPRIFGNKKKLRILLICVGLITRSAVDGHITEHVHYNGVLVEAWPINLMEFKKKLHRR